MPLPKASYPHYYFMNETVTTVVNGGIIIEELREGIRFGTDALLLADYVGKIGKAAELGSGSGIVSLLLLSKNPVGTVTGVEFDSISAKLSASNAKRNGFSERFNCVCSDVLNIKEHLPHGAFDCVFTNPPYLKNNCGLKNADMKKFAAFHETTADIDGFVAAADYLLKFGGRFCAVYRPEYLSKLLCAMEKHNIRPKRLRMIYPYRDKKPCLFLTEGKKSAKDGMIIEPPFYIYDDSSHKTFSTEMNGVYKKFEGM